MPESLVLTVAREGDSSIVIFNRGLGAKVVLPRWELALVFGQSLVYQARGVYGAEPQTVSGATLHRDGGFEVVTVGGTVFAVMPLAMAIEIGNAVIGKAREVETEESWEAVVFDQAILDRTNLLPNLGLVSDPWMQREAVKEAAWNTRLRRYLPGGVRRQRKVSTPHVDRENT